MHAQTEETLLFLPLSNSHSVPGATIRLSSDLWIKLRISLAYGHPLDRSHDLAYRDIVLTTI